MRPAALVRRSIALTAATALLSGGLSTGLFTSPAHAAGSISSFTPTQWDNRSTVALTINGTGFPVPLPVIGDPNLVIFTPVVLDAPNEVESFSIPARAGGTATRVVVDVPLAMAPTGEYSLRVADSTGGNVSPPAATKFVVYGFGPANATGVAFGPNPDQTLECDLTLENNCQPRTNIPGRPLDISGSNIAIGAKVNFLKPSTLLPATGLTFVQNNPNVQRDEGIATDEADGKDGTGYASSTLLQGNYTYAADAVAGVTPGFTPGFHKLQIVNNDGKTNGATVDFAQPWFANEGAVAPSSIGIGAQNVVITLTGQGIRAGSALSVQNKGTSTCADITMGQSTVSGPDGNGTFTTISAPASMSDCSTDNVTARHVTVTGPDGGQFVRTNIFTIAPNPSFGALQAGYDVLGQGAHVGFTPDVVNITGTGFQGQGETDPAKMARFEFGEGVTVTTVAVTSPNNAQVTIDVSDDAPLGDRVAKVINPNGGVGTAQRDELPNGDPDPLDSAPLEIVAGPKVTKVEPSFLEPSGSKQITVTGTFDVNDTYVVTVCDKLPGLDCTPSQNVNVGSVTDTATTLVFQVSTNGAAPGLRNLLVHDSTDKGRFYCVGCIGVDSLTLVSPPSAPNTGPSDAVFTLDPTIGSGLITASSRATLTRLVPLNGQPAIPQRTGTVLTQAQNGQVTASFDLRGVAPGQYSITVVKDPSQPLTSPTWSCTGCFKVTGAAITTSSIDRVPSDGTVDTTTSGGQGANDLLVKIQGANFSKGMQVSIPDVVVHDVTFTLPATGLGTELSFRVDVPAEAPLGNKAVTVSAGDGVGPDTGSKTTNLVFAVTAAPTPGAVSAPSPAAYGQGAGTAAYHAANAGQTVAITVTGENFAAGATLDLGPGVVVTDPVVTQGTPPTCVPAIPDPICTGGTPDQLTAKLAIAESAATGKRDVAVKNGDGGTGTLAQAFTVNGGPKITSVANPSGFPVLVPDGVKRTITVFGNGFVTTDPKSALSIVPADGITVENVQVVDAGKITADVTVATSATKGARTIGVTNSSDRGFGSITPIYVALKPGTVPNVKLTPLAKAIKVNWTSAANNGAPITAYHLVRKDLATGALTTVDVGGSTLTITFSNLVNGRKYEIAINAVNAAGPGPVVKKQEIAGVKTTLTLVRSRTLVTYGGTVDLSGKLTTTSATGVVSPLKSKAVTLTFIPAKGSALARTATTTSTGAWSYKGVKIGYNWTVTARYAGDSTFRPAVTGPWGVFVASKVVRTFPSSGSTSASSTTLKITGSVAPNASGRTVYLQKFSGGTWVTTSGKATLSGSSTFVISYKPGPGTYTFRVYMPKTFDLFKRNLNYQGYSAAFTLKRT